MNSSSDMILSYLNNSITESVVDNAKKYGLDLSIIKFEHKESDPKKYKEILKFINSYFDFAGIVADTNSSFLILLRNMKLHAVVLMVKNLNLALKLNYNTTLKHIAITNLDKKDDVLSITERINKFLTKSKITNSQIYYGTRYFDFNDGDINTILKKIVKNDNKLNIYGLYHDATIKIDAKILEIGDSYLRFKVSKDYLSFLKKQVILYFEHKNLADVFSGSVLKVDFENSFVEVGDLKFKDHSPIHRRHLRIEPLKPLKANLRYKDFSIMGFISDISANSILFTSQLQNIEELQKEDLTDKTFELLFNLNIYGNDFEVKVKATIFRINGNQIVLNIFGSSDTQRIINEYINMSYQQLLLQVQGKVV